MIIEQLFTISPSPTKKWQPLVIEYWDLASHCWVVVGGIDSGKEQLMSLLNGNQAYSGSMIELPATIAEVSFAQQQALVEQEIQQDESDLLDQFDPGTLVCEMLKATGASEVNINHYVARFNLTDLLQHGFRSLSTGETRKLLVACALLRQPILLLLHDPLAGIDQQTKSSVLQEIQRSAQQGTQLILLADRLSDIPDWMSHGAIFEHGKLITNDSLARLQQSDCWLQLSLTMPAEAIPPALVTPDKLADSEPIFEIKQGNVSYGDKQIFANFNWRIDKGQHWRIIGPNGSGKSTLLKLVCGDHPQCYSNWIRQFGLQRGSGESIWQIKQHIGLVSAEFHLSYRARTSVIGAVLSGFFDSIGLYQEPSRHQTNHGLAWLAWFQLSHIANEPFHQLSYGQQRLVLIIRALVKSPSLLILDEPLQGLDERSAQLVLTAINRVMAAQVGQLLYVSHRDETMLEAHCQILQLPQVKPVD